MWTAGQMNTRLRISDALSSVLDALTKDRDEVYRPVLANSNRPLRVRFLRGFGCLEPRVENRSWSSRLSNA